MPRTCAALLLVGVPLLASAEALPQALEAIPYIEEEAASAARSLDLYLPAPADLPPPLVVFVHSRFWSSAPGRQVLVDGFARPLRRAGAAVAVVRHRLAPANAHPAAAEDVAAALAFLVENADRYAYDPARIFLAGHSSGAHLAALVALDPRYLQAVGLERSAIAGVVGISGPYDLDPDGGVSGEEEEWYGRAFGNSAARRRASPERLARGDAPRFLLLAAQRDIPGYVRQGETFAAALRDAGHPDAEFFVVMGRTHASILDLEREQAGTPMHLLDFVGLQPLPPRVAELRDAVRYWRSPRRSTEAFWTSGAPVHSHAADERFVASAGRIYRGLRHKRITFRPERFSAIDLFELLEALGPERVGSGAWLVTTNAQQEQGFFRLEELRPYQPVVVIGIDGERNLFRNVDITQRLREYSWREELPPPRVSARPMGGFLYLLEPPASQALAPLTTSFSLEPSGFQLTDADPVGPLRTLAPELFAVLAEGRGCVQCHSLRGVGPRAGHLRAVDGALQGGFALPLEDYPPEVWRRFVFEPRAAAALLGGGHEALSSSVASALFELVESERRASSAARP